MWRSGQDCLALTLSEVMLELINFFRNGLVSITLMMRTMFRLTSTLANKPKRKRKRSDSVLWQKPLHQQKCQKGKVTTQTTPQKSSIKQRLRTDLVKEADKSKKKTLILCIKMKVKPRYYYIKNIFKRFRIIHVASKLTITDNALLKISDAFYSKAPNLTVLANECETRLRYKNIAGNILQIHVLTFVFDRGRHCWIKPFFKGCMVRIVFNKWIQHDNWLVPLFINDVLYILPENDVFGILPLKTLGTVVCLANDASWLVLARSSGNESDEPEVSTPLSSESNLSFLFFSLCLYE